MPSGLRSGRREEEHTLLPRILVLISPLLFMLGVACGGAGASDPDPSSTPEPPPDVAVIRDVNFRQEPQVQSALTRLGGGSVAEDEIEYADLTGDRREEAIVPITSGGTLGNISYLIFTTGSSGPSLLLTRSLDPSSRSGLSMAVENGVLIEYVGEYGPEDPFCCPSFLRKTSFRWDGSKLQVQGEERVPAGQQKQ